MKKCYVCKEEKDLSEFYKDRSQSKGFEYRCKKCKSINSKERRKNNLEYYRKKERESFLRNYESIRSSQKKFREENREKILIRRRELREPRKYELNTKEKERRKNDPNFLVKERDRQKRFRERNKEILKPKDNARKLVMFAVKLGVLNKPKLCAKCQSEGKIEGHHVDYEKPLEVIWLCKICHKQEHKKYK